MKHLTLLMASVLVSGCSDPSQEIYAENDPDKFFVACGSTSNLSVIQELISSGIDVNHRADGDVTALHVAAMNNSNPDVVSLLVTAGADINATSLDGDTPLAWAAQYNQSPEVAERIISLGADLNATSSRGLTPLLVSMANPNQEVLWSILDAGADVNIPGPSNVRALQMIASVGSERLVKRLLDAGADVNAKDVYGTSAIFTAAALNSNPNVMDLLIEYGADIHARTVDLETPLIAAATGNSNPLVVMALIKAGSDIAATDKFGNDAHHYARQNPLLKDTYVVSKLVAQVTGSIDPTTLSTSLILDDGTEVAFHFKIDVIWTTSIPSIQVGGYFGELDGFIWVSANKDSVNSKRPFFKLINGTTEKVTIELVGDPEAIQPDSFDNWSIQIPRDPMSLQIRLTAGNKSTTVSVPVRDAGLTGATVDELIASHGMGDHEHAVYVSWPDSKIVDGVRYNADAGRSKARTHWRYNSNPGLVVVLHDSTVTRIHTHPEVVRFVNEKLYIDRDLTQIFNDDEITLASASGGVRVLERTPNAVAVAVEVWGEDTYIKLWVAADRAW